MSENLLPKSCVNCIHDRLPDDVPPCIDCDENHSEFVSIENRIKQEIIESNESKLHWFKEFRELFFECSYSELKFNDWYRNTLSEIKNETECK